MEGSIIKSGKMALFVLFCMILVSCGDNGEDQMESIILEEGRQVVDQNALLEEPESSADFDEREENVGKRDDFMETETHTLIPMELQWRKGDMDYDPEDTIYYKNYYDDYTKGKARHIKYPDINIKDELEEYFLYEYDYEKWDTLVEMFFDYRTIEMPEEELKYLFYQHGYTLCLQSTETKNLHIRFVEITEIGGLSLYPTRIMIQTWDENYIYLQDITSPIPRKIMSFFVVDNREPNRMVVHSSGLSMDYVVEEELSFWEYRGTFWALVPMDLEIDTSHAHIAGENMYLDMNKDELFKASYYRDGIAYRPDKQYDGANNCPVRLGKMEVVEKNRVFRLMVVNDNGEVERAHECSIEAYIQFKIQ